MSRWCAERMYAPCKFRSQHCPTLAMFLSHAMTAGPSHQCDRLPSWACLQCDSLFPCRQVLGDSRLPLYVAAKAVNESRYAPLHAVFPQVVYLRDIVDSVLPGVPSSYLGPIEQVGIVGHWFCKTPGGTHGRLCSQTGECHRTRRSAGGQVLCCCIETNFSSSASPVCHQLWTLPRRSRKQRRAAQIYTLHICEHSCAPDAAVHTQLCATPQLARDPACHCWELRPRSCPSALPATI